MTAETNWLRSFVPWWVRILAKIVLARMPLSYRFWKSLRLFEHGVMDQPSRALDGFLQHATTAGLVASGASARAASGALAGKSILEIGPGDSLFTAIIGSALDAKHTWLVDSGQFATADVTAYRAMFSHLAQFGLPSTGQVEPNTVDSIITFCNASYLTRGVPSLAEIPSESVDYHFSNAVLEHISKSEFERFCIELRRVTSPLGVGVHRVDLQDHLGGRLNNLRFSNRVWEGKLFSKSGFYTNRIRFNKMIGYLESSGFRCDVTRVATWKTLPTARHLLNEEFRYLPEEDLKVQGFDLLLRPK